MKLVFFWVNVVVILIRKEDTNLEAWQVKVIEYLHGVRGLVERLKHHVS